MTLPQQLARTQLELAMSQAQCRSLERNLFEAEKYIGELERQLEQARSLATSLEEELAQ